MKDWINKQYQENISPEDKLAPLQFDFEGKSVIDLGCNIGLVADYVFKRGATQYLGVDNNPDYEKYWKDRQGTFHFGDLKDCEHFKADIIMAIGIFHHLTDDELVELRRRKLRTKTLIIEAPTQGQSKNYNVRSVKQYENIFYNYTLKAVYDSGFKTPPVKREIMVFERN